MTEVWDEVTDALGAAVAGSTVLHGGDINDAYRVELTDGRTVFVKANHRAPADMFAAEARGLRWLAEPQALRIPEVLAVGDRFLALEYLEPGPRTSRFDQQLGEGLSRLHRASAGDLGLAYDNYLATLPQANQSRPTWSEFYARQRLEPLVRRAVDGGVASASWTSEFDRLFERLPDLVPTLGPELEGSDELVARLHGDLWSGNVHVNAQGGPCLIDPAVYGGHREVDLAMLALFGNPSARFFDAYESVWALSPGWRERVALYQLYPLLAHVNLFGSGYTRQTERALRGYL